MNMLLTVVRFFLRHRQIGSSRVDLGPRQFRKRKKILQERKMSTHVMVTRSKSRKKPAQSSKLRQKDIAEVEPEKKRRKKEVPKVPEFSEEASRPLYQNFSPQSPISPRLYKFPSSVDMSPRIGPISVSLKHHVHVMPPQLALNVKKNDKMKDDFLTWKKKVNLQLYNLGSPKHTDDLPDCNLRDMFDQCVGTENAARVAFRKKIMLDDYEEKEDFDENKQIRLFQEWKEQVNSKMKKKYGLVSVDLCYDLNWRDMFDQGVCVDSAVRFATQKLLL